MKTPFLNFVSLLPILLILVMSFPALASDMSPPKITNTSSDTDSGDAASALPTNVTAVPSPPGNSPIPNALVTPSSTTASKTDADLIVRDLPEIHATISLPKDWTLIPGKLLEGDVLLATREKISSENDLWTTGLSMTVDRNGAKDSGQKASEYALGLAQEAKEKAGDEATPLKESQLGAFHEIRFDFPVAGDQPLLVTEVMRANDATGTLVVILWQSSQEEAEKLKSLKESILTGIKLDPTQ